jgi:hypothetical protein
VATLLRASPRQETSVVLDAWASSPAVVYTATEPIGVPYFGSATVPITDSLEFSGPAGLTSVSRTA